MSNPVMKKKDDDDDVADEKKKTSTRKTSLFIKVEDWKWPIVYSPEYNIGFMGLEKLHPFDSQKWGRVHEYLIEFGLVQEHTTVRPQEATNADLMVVHPKRYIDSLKLTTIIEGIQEWSVTVAGITEIPPVALLPNFIVQRKVLKPFRFQTGGTILAARLALDRGWAINIGGGFHHCCADRGGGFCAYADITLAIRFLQQRHLIEKAMIIDLDAHQGNGHERDFMNDKSVYILDIYNRSIYPHDGYAKRGISRKIELSSYTEDDEYLHLVKTHCEGALNEFKPDLVVYNAGTDIMDGDPLGQLSITPQGIVERDEIVFRKAMSRGLPILMLTSGGYQRSTAQIIANSILNLHAQDLIDCPEAANAPPPPTVPEPPAPQPPVVQSNMKRSASDGTGLFARLRRTTNCWSISRSQTSINDAKEDVPKNLTSSQPKLDLSDSDDEFPPLKHGNSEPDIRITPEIEDNPHERETPDEKLSLVEALSGLRNEIPRSLENITIVQCRINDRNSKSPTDENLVVNSVNDPSTSGMQSESPKS